MTKTIHSFKELRAEMQNLHPDWKIREPKPRKERVRKCKKCGSEMTHIPDTNIWICPGVEPTKQEPCGNVLVDN